MSNLENKIKSIFEKSPIPFDEIPQDSHYLRGKDKSIMLKRVIDVDVNAIKKMLSKMSWKKIKFNISGDTYTPVLPTPIINEIKKLYAGESPASTSEMALKFPSDFLDKAQEAARLHFCTGSYSFKGTAITSSNIYMNIDGSNRTHFPNGGISDQLRNTGLGKKLYRAIIEKNPWVQTNSAGTEVKNWMWASLTHQQFKADGTRDKDAEIFSFRFGSGLYAVSTTRPDKIEAGYDIINKISDKSKLMTKELRIENGLGIDEDFIELCKANKETNPKAQQVVSWLDTSPEDLRRAEEAEEQRQAAERERRAAEERRLNGLLGDRLQAYCGVSEIENLSSDWDLGDWITIRLYLLQQDFSDLPVRKVTKQDGDTYYAYKPTDTSETDSRRTSNKADWVKALPPAIGSNYPPGIMRTPANAARRPNVGSGPRIPTPTNTGSTTTNNDNIRNVQGLFPNSASAEKENVLQFTNPERKRFLRDNGSPEIYIPKYNKLSIQYKYDEQAIFGYFIKPNYIFNSKTMEYIDNNTEHNNIIINSCNKYLRSQLEDKRELSEGDLVFIKMHSKYFGYVAKVMGTALTNRGDKYVYLRVPGAGRSNRLTLTPRALDKLTLINDDTNESKINNLTSTPNFNKYLEKIKESKIIKESLTYKEAFNKIITYCEELMSADLIDDDSAIVIDKELGKFKTTEANALKEVLEELNDSNLLPYDTNGGIEEPEEILELFDIYKFD